MHSELLQNSARDLGLPPSWGNPSAIPAYGGTKATDTWRKLGLHTRPGVGGIPCELLHAEVGSSLGLTSSCTANAALRFLTGFKQALAIYLPVRPYSLSSFAPQLTFMMGSLGALPPSPLNSPANFIAAPPTVRDSLWCNQKHYLFVLIYCLVLVCRLLLPDIRLSKDISLYFT